MLSLTVAAVALTSNILRVTPHGLWFALIPRRVLECMSLTGIITYLAGKISQGGAFTTASGTSQE